MQYVFICVINVRLPNLLYLLWSVLGGRVRVSRVDPSAALSGGDWLRPVPLTKVNCPWRLGWAALAYYNNCLSLHSGVAPTDIARACVAGGQQA